MYKVKKFLHLMRMTNFTASIVQFYESFFSNSNHTICYNVKKGDECPIDVSLGIKQIEYRSQGGKITRLKAFIHYLFEYDYIVLHGLHCIDDFSGLVYCLPKYIFKKKVIWIEWGGDLYEQSRSKVKNYLCSRVKKSVGTVVAIFPPDADTYKKKYPSSKARVIYAPYCGPFIPDFYKTIYNYSSLLNHPKDKPIFVQIGNNAKEENHHIEVLEDLSRYKNDNIVVFLPLCYGNSSEYICSVQNLAEKLFPGKTYILREMMDRKQYFNLLNEVDIAIFNTDRQIGLGNLYFLIWKRAKIYMNHATPMFEYFRNEGVPISDYSSLKSQSFKAFCEPQSDYDEVKFRHYINSHTSIEERVNAWRAVYDCLDN